MDIAKQFPVYVEPGTPFNNILETASALAASPNRKNLEAFDDLHIIQIGAGGTGGYVAAEILRFIGGLPDLLQEHIYYTLIDGDRFEPKNLARQLCTEDDMGEYKSVAIINNYGGYFGCRPDRVKAIPAYITDINQLTCLQSGALPDAPAFRASKSLLRNNRGLLYPFNRIDLGGDTYEDTERFYLLNNVSTARVHTIIMDCVDKNAPRKLICDSLTSWANGMGFDIPKPLTDILWEDIKPKGANYKHEWERSSYNLIFCPEDPVSHNILRSGAPAVYVISTGNDKYTGQVYWGRYSSMIGQVPVFYQDVFGDADVSPIFAKPWKDKIKSLPEDYTMGDAELHLAKTLMHFSKADSAWEGGIFSNLPLAYTVSGTDMHGVEATPINEKLEFENVPAFMSRYLSVPLPYYIFPNLTDLESDRREEAMSCAERAAINVQNINVNRTAAQFMVNYFCSIFRGIYPIEGELPIPMSTVGVRFDIRTNSVTPEYLTTEYMRRCYAQMRGLAPAIPEAEAANA